METQSFEIPTRDGRTRLTGQVDLPASDDTARLPAVLIVPGGWFMERDGYMGGSGTERDLIYRDLGKDIVAAGLAVVRYDNRGVRRNEMTMPPCPDGSSELEVTKHYLNACVDPDIRQTVTVQTQIDDVEDVWNFTINHPRIDPKRVLIWAHSEGCCNTTRLIGARRICPRGVIFVGTATESPSGLFRWQTVDRYAEHVMAWDADRDGRVTEADIEREFPRDPLFAAVGIRRGVLTPPDEGWTLEAIQARFAEEYEATKASALAKPDDAPYPDPCPEFPMVVASNNWWKQWFTDTTPMIDHLTGYLGRVSFHFGEIDAQNSGERQFAFAESRIKIEIFARPPRLVLHRGRGHSLRTGEPAAGPMDAEVKACLVKEIEELLLTD
jgi:pimeloyl-ACP methyl ester carboxylesterase